MKKFVMLSLSLFLFFGLAQTDTDTSSETAETADSVTEGSVMDVIAANPDLSTLYAALQTAGLDATLTGEGPFTLFAPSNEAFAAAGIDLATIDPNELQTVLLYHVVSGDYASADVSALPAVMTLEGGELSVGTDAEGAVTFNDAAVSQADLMASNGTVHIVDTVLIPPTSE